MRVLVSLAVVVVLAAGLYTAHSQGALGGSSWFGLHITHAATAHTAAAHTKATHAKAAHTARPTGRGTHIATSRTNAASTTQRAAASAPGIALAPAGYATTLASPTLRAAVEEHLKHNAAMAQHLSAGILFDVRSGQVLWERDPTAEHPIASLTKMMTALLTVAESSTKSRVMITKQAHDYTGSGVGVLPLGKRVPELALLYGLLLPSGNDAAIALAQHVGGTTRTFIGMMNRQARAMGLTCTRYDTVSGVVDRGNHSCVVDLAQLAYAVLMNRELSPIVASRQVAVKFPIKGGKLYLSNNNPLLVSGYPGADGVKTGYTSTAGMCLVAAAKRGRRWLAVVLLHSANWTTQSEALLNAGFTADH
jgi:D-alanyl-D-alanine carboxypeptidase